MHECIESVLLIALAQADNTANVGSPGPASVPATLPAAPASDPVPPASTQLLELLGPTFTQTHWTGWLMLLVGIFGGLLVGKLLQAVFRDLARRMEQRHWVVRASVLNYAAGPASLAMLTLGLGIGVQGPYISAEVTPFIAKTIGLLYIIAIGWFLFNVVDLVDLALRRLTAKTATKIDDTIMPLLRKTLRIFLLIMLVLFVAENIFGADITAWLAGLGIAGLAISLAAQDSVKNLFGSVTVLIERPFSVGDRIVFMGYDGVVETIGFRSSKIRTSAGHLVTIPNMRFTDNTVENISARPFINRSFNITLRHDTAPGQVQEAVKVIQDVLNAADITPEHCTPEKPSQVFFNALNADSLNIAVSYWYAINTGKRDFNTYQSQAQEINLRIMRGLSHAGIETSIPTQTVVLQKT